MNTATINAFDPSVTLDNPFGQLSQAEYHDLVNKAAYGKDTQVVLALSQHNHPDVVRAAVSNASLPDTVREDIVKASLHRTVVEHDIIWHAIYTNKLADDTLQTAINHLVANCDVNDGADYNEFYQIRGYVKNTSRPNPRVVKAIASAPVVSERAEQLVQAARERLSTLSA